MKITIAPILALALAQLASCACGRGATPTPAPAPPPDAATTGTSVDASPAVTAEPPQPVDAAAPSPDASAGGDAAGYRTRRLITCTITTVDGNEIVFICDRAVDRRWKGELWNDSTDKAITGSRFEIVGVQRPDRLTAAARLPRPLADYGDVKTVRVVEQY